MPRPHWENCIVHFDIAVSNFIAEYFAESDRKCLVVAAAGFDPRSRRITSLLAQAMGERLSGLFVREERAAPDDRLVAAANANSAELEAIVTNAKTVSLDVFGSDEAPIAGSQIAKVIANLDIPPDTTDIVLDMTALSIGIGFPAGRLLLDHCEKRGLAFHIMITSNPELDDQIASEPADRPMAVRGFAGADHSGAEDEVARIWVPWLSKQRASALVDIGRSLGETYKICPVVPFPARNPRRADALVSEFQTQLMDEWRVDPRDLVHVSERNPLDCYRILSTLKVRYEQTMADVFTPSIVLSPIGSRVMAAGAWMAAVEHDFPVHYQETLRYDYDTEYETTNLGPELIVHLLLSGPAYDTISADASEAEPGEEGTTVLSGSTGPDGNAAQ
ncbi:MAG: hypothetical protein WA979_13385 [Pacificimonas sp.]